MQSSYVKEKWFIKNLKPKEKIDISKFNIDEVTLKLILNRGVSNEEEMREFLNPEISNLHSPILLPNLVKAGNILQNHLREKNKIRIVGDYDVDGIMSSFILTDSLRKLGADVDFRIPLRVEEGYGINESIIEECLRDGIKLIITCDNGIAAFKPIELAREKFIDVIVTDHHEIPLDENNEEILVTANAIINPKLKSSTYPFKDICGACVAFKLCEYMWMLSGKDLDDFYNVYLGPLSIATICDVMPLVKENRIIVKNGLERLEKWDNVGFKALVDILGIKFPFSNYHVGFIIGPTLNSSGRFEDAKMALNLLFEEQTDRALEMAENLKNINDQRKNKTEEAFKKGIAMVESLDLLSKLSVLIIYLKDVHESICGIVAGKIKELYNRPTIVLTNTDKGLKGSGRSIESYHMFEKISKSKGFLKSFGGHKMACGLSLDEDLLKDFITDVQKKADLTEDDLFRKILIDAKISFSDLNMDRVLNFKKLEPCGNENPQALFGTIGARVKGIQILGKNKNFIKIFLVENEKVMEATLFEDGQAFVEKFSNIFSKEEVDKALKSVNNNIVLDICYSPVINEFMGKTSIQLKLKSYRKSGV